MSVSSSDLEMRLTDLKTSFDQAFALPPSALVQDLTELAMIIVGGQRFAIQFGQLAGLEAKLQIVHVPSELPGLLRLRAIRGNLVPILDLD